MTLQQIKANVLNGKKVHWASEAYEVRVNGDAWLIVCTLNNNVIGLTWRDGVTLNGREEHFYEA